VIKKTILNIPDMHFGTFDLNPLVKSDIPTIRPFMAKPRASEGRASLTDFIEY